MYSLKPKIFPQLPAREYRCGLAVLLSWKRTHTSRASKAPANRFRQSVRFVGAVALQGSFEPPGRTQREIARRVAHGDAVIGCAAPSRRGSQKEAGVSEADCLQNRKIA